MSEKKLTQKLLKTLVHYDPDTGVWKRNKKYDSYGRKNISYSKIAGYVEPSGYKRIWIGNKPYSSSRLAWLYVEGYWPEHQIDHINRIKDDDRWRNLRHVTPQCNIRNRGINKNSSTGISGVYWNKRRNKFRAHIKNYKNFHLGYYKNFYNAVCARLAAEQCLGWESCDSSSPAYQYVQGMLK